MGMACRSKRAGPDLRCDRSGWPDSGARDPKSSILPMSRPHYCWQRKGFAGRWRGTVNLAIHLFAGSVDGCARPDMFAQKALNAAPEIDTVLWQPPTMAFFTVFDPFDLAVVLFDC